MTGWRATLLVVLALGALPAWAQEIDAVLVANEPPSAAAAGLAAGEQALRSHDAKRLMAAARQLAAAGAHSVEGDDLATTWAHQAVLWGARPAAAPLRRGRLLGPGYRLVTLAPGARYQTRQVFAAGQAARVELVALDQGAFRLAIVPDGGSPVCQRAGRSGSLACRWVPLYSSQHEIRVENGETKTAIFYLVTF